MATGWAIFPPKKPLYDTFFVTTVWNFGKTLGFYSFANKVVWHNSWSLPLQVRGLGFNLFLQWRSLSWMAFIQKNKGSFPRDACVFLWGKHGSTRQMRPSSSWKHGSPKQVGPSSQGKSGCLRQMHPSSPWNRVAQGKWAQVLLHQHGLHMFP